MGDAAVTSARPLTQDQEKALDVARHTAVSAGAGSGKTTVLVERYLRTIEAGRAGALVRPSEILALTFTKKAAAEMRARVHAALAERAARDPRLLPLREEIHAAPIATIHAFCASVLRELAVAAGIDPAFEVLEGVEQRVLLGEAIEDLLRERAAGADPETETLARIYRRGELARALAGLAAKRGAARRWAEEVARASDEELLARWRAVRPVDPVEVFGDLGPIEAEAAGRDGLAEKAREALRARAEALGALDLGERSGNARALCILRRLALPGGPFARNDGKPREFGGRGRADARDALTALARRVVEAGAGAIADLDEAALPALRALARLFQDLLHRYDARKRRRAALDFDDLLARTAALLRARPDVRRAIAGRFAAVLVDEFQDVDPVQWEILSSLAGPTVFAVGDEKQSIYRFRGADVSVFRELRERLAREGGALVPLDENFRTLEGPLAFANELFAKVFGGAGGGADFEARPGALRCRREDATEAGPGIVELIVRPSTPGAHREPAAPDEREEENGFEDALDEAELAARAIRRLLDDPEARVKPDAKTPARRPLAGDVAILLRRRRNLKLFEAALRRHGIPFAVHGGIGFFRAPEVVDAANLLAFLADPREDVALAGLLRSPLCGLTDGGLYLVARMNAGAEGAALYDRLRAAAERGGLDPADLVAARDSVRLLERLRAIADRAPVPEILRLAFEESGAYAALATGPRGRQALANLAKLLDLARDFEERGFRGLARLAEMLRFMIDAEEEEGEADLAAAGPSSSLGAGDAAPEAVRILTVHAAKGLEFPVVLVPEVGAPPFDEYEIALLEEVGGRDAEGRRLYEVGLRVPDPARGCAPAETGLRRLLRQRARAKADAESRRLFYVACTRARDRIVLLGSAAAREGSWAAARGSWLQMLIEAGAKEAGGIAGLAIVDVEGLRGAGRGVEEVVERVVDRVSDRVSEGSLPQPPPEGRGAPAPLATSLPVLSPSKWRVLAACPRKYYYDATLRIPEWPRAEAAAARGAGAEGLFAPAEAAQEDLAARARLRGIVVHELLEAGIGAADPAIEREVARVLADLGAEGAELASAIAAAARAAIAAVEKSEVGRLLASADEVRRERAFVWRVRAGGRALGEVEGRLDVLARAGERHVIVDWKTDEVPPEDAARAAEARGYLSQLRLYALAVARILGLDRVEGVIFFTGSGTAVREEYDGARLDAIEEALRRDLAAIAGGAIERAAAAPCAACGYGRSGVCDVADAR